MKMKGLQAFLILLTLALSGCTTTKPDMVSMESFMDSWVGSHIDDVTAEWGAPSNQIARSDGGHTYSWETITANQYRTITCKQTFVTGADGYIRTWSAISCPSSFYN